MGAKEMPPLPYLELLHDLVFNDTSWRKRVEMAAYLNDGRYSDELCAKVAKELNECICVTPEGAIDTSLVFDDVLVEKVGVILQAEKPINPSEPIPEQVSGH